MKRTAKRDSCTETVTKRTFRETVDKNTSENSVAIEKKKQWQQRTFKRIQTRAMTEAQCMDVGAQRDLGNNQERVQGANPTTRQETINPAMNPTVDLHRTDDIIIEEFIRRQGAISLDWYVPDFCNTQVGVLIKNRLPIKTTKGRILFNCPPLNECFLTSTFELDLTTG